MKITSLDDVEPRPRRVAVGTFDGVHLGHREVIAGSDTVLTFEPHPVSVLHPEAAPKLLTTLQTKAELIAGLGVRELVVIDFTHDFAALAPEEFIAQVLIGRLGATRVSVGENFRFGHKARGDAELLHASEAFETRVAPLVEVEGETVTSSHIRGLVQAGEVDVAQRLLGAPFELRGEVVDGDRRGRELGFPTANIIPDDAYVHPGNGIYACLADDRPAAVNVGVRPTFPSGRGLLIEVHLIDWSGDLYGQELRVQFLRRLRGERAFHSVAALVEQMARDVQEAREVSATVSRP